MRLLAFVVAASLLSVGANATELLDAFKSGKFKGEIKTIYVSTPDDPDGVGPKTQIGTNGFAVGGELGYKTASFRGWKLGVTAQTSSTMGLGSENDDVRAAVSGTNITEAYLEYAFDKKTSVKLGRQYIRTPLIYTSFPAWIVRNSFDIYAVKTKAIPKTVVWAGAVTKYYRRDVTVDEDANTVDFHDPIYSVFATNKSIKGLTLKGQFLLQDGKTGPALPDFNSTGPHKLQEQNFFYYMADASYKLPIDLPVWIRGSYWDMDYDTVDKDSDKYTIGASVKLGSLPVKLNYDYGEVSDHADIFGSLGDAPIYRGDASLMQSTSGNWAGTESHIVKLDILVNKCKKKSSWGCFMRFNLAHGEFDTGLDGSAGRKFSNTNFDIVYNHDGILEGLRTRTRFTRIHHDVFRGTETDTNQDEFRFTATYMF